MKLARVCLAYHRQQRIMVHPILIHCLAGSGKTAIFLMIASAMAEIDVGQSPDMIQMAAHVFQQRKGILKEKEHFKQALLGVTKHAKDILIKKGKLPPEVKKAIPEPQQSGQGDIGDLTAISNQLGFEIKPSNPTLPSEECKKPDLIQQQTHPKTGIFSPELSKLADLSIDSSNKKKKITKEDFTSKKGMKPESNPNDPLSQLDPMWSLK